MCAVVVPREKKNIYYVCKCIVMAGNLSVSLNACPRCPNTERSLNDAFKNTSDWLLNPLWFPLQLSGSEDQPLLHRNKEKERDFEKVIKCVVKCLPYESR